LCAAKQALTPEPCAQVRILPGHSYLTSDDTPLTCTDSPA